MKYKQILVTQEDCVVTVTLNRPAKHNAFEPQMIGELTAAFSELAKNSTARVVILQGAGKSFCSGGDLEWMKSMVHFSFVENVRDSEALFDMYSAIRNCPLPVIGRVHGNAMGGALGLVAVCDIVASERDSQFCFTEVKWGLAPAVISPFVCEKIKRNLIYEWMLTARVFTAEEARDAGLVNFVGNQTEIIEYVQKTVDRLLSVSSQGIRETKRLLRVLAEEPWSEFRRQCTETIAERRVSAEGQHGLKAFLEKRDPQWKTRGPLS